MSSEEVFDLYKSLHVPMHVMDNLSSTSRWKLTQFLDMFSQPEATLYADVSQVRMQNSGEGVREIFLLQFLLEKNISYDPENLFEDVQTTIQTLHSSGQIHAEISSNLGACCCVHVLSFVFLHYPTRPVLAGKSPTACFLTTAKRCWEAAFYRHK